jgi:hypothetical protein
MRVDLRLFSLLVLLGSAACTETGTLRLDGQVAQAQAALSTGQSSQSLTLGEGSLIISRARVAVSEIELEGGSDDEREAEMGAAIIDLNLDGAPTSVAVADVEAGTYHTLGLELVSRDISGQTASIFIEGTVDGAAFTFSSTWAPEAEFPLEPEVDVPANGEATAGVVFDVASWFSNADGSVIDPNEAGAREQIESRIIGSISAAASIESSGDGDD